MNSFLTIILGVVAALTLFCVPLESAADPGLEPRDGVLVLRNGNLIRGRIWPHGGGFLVAMEGRNEIRLGLDQVAYECRDVEEAFDFKSLELIPGDVNSHVKLAVWCLKEDLLDHAQRQFEVANGISPNHPAVRKLARRLQVLAKRRTESTVDGLSPESDTAETLQKGSPKIPVSALALDAFRKEVQPVLLNHCALAGCHGERATTAFRIRRNPWRGAIPRPFTLRNLEAAVHQINPKDPRNSPLLKHARVFHGPADARQRPQITATQYELLKDWVYRAVGVEIIQPKVFQATRGNGKTESNHVTSTILSGGSGGLRQPGGVAGTSGALSVAGASVAGQQTVRQIGTLTLDSTTAEQFVAATDNLSDATLSDGTEALPPHQAGHPRDPFDPAWFNSQYADRVFSEKP